MALKTHGTMAVDWENRVDFDRLVANVSNVQRICSRSRRWAPCLFFDMNNVRYLTATHDRRGRRIKRIASRSCRRMTSRFYGISDQRPDTINCIAHGWAIVQGRGISMLRGSHDARDGTRGRRGKEDPHRT